MKLADNRLTELDNCRFVRAVLTLIIVFYHSIIFWSGDWFTKNPVFQAIELNALAKWLNSFHIYGFALISGYLFYYQKYENGKYQQFFSFILNKAKRLLIPYFFVAFAWAMPAKLFLQNSDFLPTFTGYLLGTEPNQLWFLLMLFDVFVLVWPFSSIVKKNDFLALVIAGGFYLLGIVGSKFLPNYFQIWTSFKYLVFFLIGYKIRQHGSAFLMRIPGWSILVCDIILFCLSHVLSGLDFIAADILSLGTRFVCNAVGAIMVFVLPQKIVLKKPSLKNKFVKYIDKKSMSIYLFHQQIVYVFIVLFNGVLHPYIHAAVNFLGSLAFSIIIAEVFSRFRLTKYLIGEK